MTQTIIEYNETDFEANLQDYYTCMSYKGELFTGTLVDGNMTTQFKNGNAHGKSVEYYDNGQIANESYFDDGDYISYKTWHLNGKTQSEWPGRKSDSFEYDMDGNIILKNDNFFYRNGNFRKRNIPYKTEFYNYEGELMVVIQQNLTEYEKPLFHVNKEKFTECYVDLYFELYPYTSSYQDNLDSYILGWLWHLLSQSEDDKKFAITAC
ncbi:hypothetical protein [Chryseobacterium jejuense]|uniref:hypothetical protein n=1 Tax=Chryseobacterium jejuense TaxID=445960 RepID=UPI001AE9F37A|nr:hypothetical protein [Chryseobacterium jejuense]MBP2615567.1 hypothetical protein [Chryseobacterium jejuense]